MSNFELPKINAPTYNTTLPDSKVEVKFRPYLVKEEKYMVVAAESDDSDIDSVLSQIIENCTFGAVISSTLSSVDMEWLLLQIRIKSKGDSVELVLDCCNEVNDKECKHRNTIGVKLSDAMVIDNKVSDVINFDSVNGVKMKRISLKENMTITAAEPSTRDFDLVVASLDQFFFGDDVFVASDLAKEAIENFLNDLTGDQLDMLIEYVHNAPKIVVTANFVCEKCGYKEDVKIAGIDNFFG